MRRALVTVNFGNVLCANARASFEAASQRWGASYVELTENNTRAGGLTEVLMLRARLFDIVDTDRVFSVDGSDVLIAASAPSPFDACPPASLGAVRNAWRRFVNYGEILGQELREWQAVNAALGKSLPRPDWFFNTGVMVLSRPAHARLMERARELVSTMEAAGNHLPWPDQTAINYAAAELGAPVCLMDETWNFVHPEQVGHWRYMEEYVYHFAGDRERRASVLPQLPWQAPCPQTHRAALWRAALRAYYGLASRAKHAVKGVPILGPACRRLWWAVRGHGPRGG